MTSSPIAMSTSRESEEHMPDLIPSSSSQTLPEESLNDLDNDRDRIRQAGEDRVDERDPALSRTPTVISESNQPSSPRLDDGEAISDVKGRFSGYTWQQDYEPTLREMAKEGHMTSDWPTLLRILKCSLVAVVTAYLRSTPARFLQHHQGHPTNSVLESTSSIDSFAASPPLSAYRTVDEEPSTSGGLVIPPFPPRRLKPETQPGVNGSMEDVSSRSTINNGGVSDPEAAIGGKVLKSYLTPSEAWDGLEGIFKLLDDFTAFPVTSSFSMPKSVRTGAKNGGGDDEIGDVQMKGSGEGGDSPQIASSSQPPFTIQRVAELALDPIKCYKSAGKFLRAIEKILRVSTAYTEGSSFASLGGGQGALGAEPTGRSASQSSVDLSPGSNMPLFSPIPFLLRDGNPQPGDEFDISSSPATAVIVDPTPLMLGAPLGSDDDPGRLPDSKADTHFIPTGLHNVHPETITTTGTTTTASSITGGHVDPGNEPFNGRVDELDAGPVLLSENNSPSASSIKAEFCNEADDVDHRQLHAESSNASQQGGVGESGTMTPHAISDRPHAISSTTDLSVLPISTTQTRDGQEAETPPTSPGGTRRIAALPRTSSLGSLTDRFRSAEVLEASEGDAEAGGYINSNVGLAVTTSALESAEVRDGVQVMTSTDGVEGVTPKATKMT